MIFAHIHNYIVSKWCSRFWEFFFRSHKHSTNGVRCNTNTTIGIRCGNASFCFRFNRSRHKLINIGIFADDIENILTGFGATPASSAPSFSFGGTTTSAAPAFSFGQTAPAAQNTTFGGFGAPAASNAFGAPATSNAFGAPATSSAFGAPAVSGFGGFGAFGGQSSGSRHNSVPIFEQKYISNHILCLQLVVLARHRHVSICIHDLFN